MDKIEVSTITLMQTPESDEARELWWAAKRKYRIYFLFCVAIFVISLIIFICGICLTIDGCIIFSYILFVVFLVSCIVYWILKHKYLRPYIELLRIAISNDKLRHDERIRWRERARLEMTERGKLVRELMLRKTSQLNKRVDKIKDNINQTPNDAEKEYKIYKK